MKTKFLYGLLLFPLLCACQWDGKLTDDTQTTKKVEINRYDRIVNEYVAINNASDIQRMNTQYPQETRLLVEEVLGIGRMDDPNIKMKLRLFYKDTTLNKLAKDVENRFTEMTDEEKAFTEAFKALSKDIPNFQTPRVYTQISALDQSVVVGDSILGISLDKYLGSDYPLYKSYFYDFQTRSMTRERIVPEALNFYLQNKFPLPTDTQQTLMERVLHTGKINWIIYHEMGNVSMDYVIGFSKERSNWCKENRNKIWVYLNELHPWESTDLALFRTVMMPANNTPALGLDSSDAVGLWWGIRAIDAYMTKHKNVTVAQLLADNDYQTIFNEAGYK